MKRKHPVITNFEARSVLLMATLTLGTAGHALAQGPAVPAAREQNLGTHVSKANRESKKFFHAEEAKTVSASISRSAQVNANMAGAGSPVEFAGAEKGSEPAAE